MAIYTVLAPPARDDETRPDPMRTVFVKDGFSWPALFIAVPWMIFRRMWLVLIAYLVVAVGGSFLLSRVGDDAAGIAAILLVLLFALEANNLRRWTLERRGYRLVGIAEGRNLEEAEVRFFASLDEPEPVTALPPVPPTPPAPPMPPTPPWANVGAPTAEASEVVGLFPAPATPRGTPS